MSLSPGTRPGHYVIWAPLGVGGMGEVYRATDRRLGRIVALKVLPEDFAGDPDRQQRFSREARTLAALTHPNIVQIYDVGEEGCGAYIAMEYVEGRTLQELLATGPLPPERTVDLATQIAQGLAKAHASGVIDRDLKPANIVVNEDGLPKILDFGLARMSKELVAAESNVDTLEGIATNPGTVLGTPGFMSPEQVTGRRAELPVRSVLVRRDRVRDGDRKTGISRRFHHRVPGIRR